MICCSKCGQMCREHGPEGARVWSCTVCLHVLSQREIDEQRLMVQWLEGQRQRKERIPKMTTKELITELTEEAPLTDRIAERVALARLLYWTQHIFVKSGCFSSGAKW